MVQNDMYYSSMVTWTCCCNVLGSSLIETTKPVCRLQLPTSSTFWIFTFNSVRPEIKYAWAFDWISKQVVYIFYGGWKAGEVFTELQVEKQEEKKEAEIPAEASVKLQIMEQETKDEAEMPLEDRGNYFPTSRRDGCNIEKIVKKSAAKSLPRPKYGKLPWKLRRK